ncbi:DUF2848 domain-containing protein [uncultured Roseobacter sp.]|uniref:DUF2848 domain-containing protein n=1 Tax=uncultured Roseobacter sp. TaxID=114847 RepID=UPI0026387A5A|nr:DUF2848 domain-containing protein [uncultured Roseobacter sp.]
MQFETSVGTRDVEIHDVYVAGWTGRDRAAVDHHIAELAAIGVSPPSQVPLYYRVSADLLTQTSTIQVLGTETSGEIEPLVIRSEGEIWLGLASDHTDRALETVSVAASKQICHKPVSTGLWRMAEVEDRLDDLILTCKIRESNAWVTYQSGTLASIRPLSSLIAGIALQDGQAMLCGTLAAVGGVRPAADYRMSLTDPKQTLQLSLDYAVTALPSIT